jgi:hypothetical protein
MLGTTSGHSLVKRPHKWITLHSPRIMTWRDFDATEQCDVACMDDVHRHFAVHCHCCIQLHWIMIEARPGEATWQASWKNNMKLFWCLNHAWIGGYPFNIARVKVFVYFQRLYSCKRGTELLNRQNHKIGRLFFSHAHPCNIVPCDNAQAGLANGGTMSVDYCKWWPDCNLPKYRAGFYAFKMLKTHWRWCRGLKILPPQFLLLFYPTYYARIWLKMP